MVATDTKKTRLGTWLVALVLVAGLGLAWLNRNNIYDWWRLRGYQPSAQIAQLVTADTMTDYARHMFYVNRPVLQNQADFNKSCPDDGGEQTIILGCYRGNQTGIYLYSIQDPKLNGVQQVTAAHETLHAIYDRLSSKDRQAVDKMLQDFYEQDLKDERVLQTIEAYKKSEPNDVVNEMHSVFATEIEQLPPALEAYYKQYFRNRQQIVKFAKQYQQTFVDNKALGDKYQAQIKNIEDQLNSLKTKIDGLENQLRQDYAQIERDRGGAVDVSSFNARVRDYNNQAQSYRDQISQYNQLINLHNDLVAKYQALTVETNHLIQELDSRSSSVKNQ